MGTLVRGSLALIMALSLMGAAQAAVWNFQAIVESGYLAGQFGSGTLTFDDSITEGLVTPPELALTFAFQGQSFDETHHPNYPGAPAVDLFEDPPLTIPWTVSYWLEDGVNGVAFGDPNIKALKIDDSARDIVGNSFEVTLMVELHPDAVIPVPASLPLLVSALTGVGFLGWRRTHTRVPGHSPQ